MCYLYQRAPLSYQSLDEKGNFIDVNDTWLCLMGYEAHEVIGKNFSEFLHPDWKDHFKENFPMFKAVGEVLGVEFEMVKKDGTKILVSFHGKIGCDPHGSFKQTHCIFRDITEIRQSEAEIQKQKTFINKNRSSGKSGGIQWLFKRSCYGRLYELRFLRCGAKAIHQKSTGGDFKLYWKKDCEALNFNK